jgi:hypothetical protein
MFKKLISSTIIIFIIISVFLPFDTQAKELELKYPTLPGGLELTDKTTVPELIEYLFSFLIFTAGIIAFGAIVAAGFMFITSGANPGLRAEAQKRLRNVFLGLLILFSSYLLLRTINPELVDLKLLEDTNLTSKFAEKEVTGDDDSDIDYDTLRYGGVVIYEDAELAQDKSSSAGAWETVLQDIPNFNNSWIDDGTDYGNFTSVGGSKTISAIKILGKCTVQLYKDATYPDGSSRIENGNPITGPIVIPISSIPYNGSEPKAFSEDNNVMELKFISEGNYTGRDCMGHSTRVYQDINYNNWGILDFGVHTFIYSIPDLDDVHYQDEGLTIEDTIESIAIAGQSGVNFSLNEMAVQNQTIVFCDRKNYEDGGSGCISPQKSLLNLSSIIKKDDEGKDSEVSLNNRISSIDFTTLNDRQAGVILYENEDNFDSGRQEIVITSLRNIEQGFVINEDKRDKIGVEHRSPFNNEGISGIRIIGRYRVTLYRNTDWSIGGSLGHWIIFDNTNPDAPTYQRNIDLEAKPIPDQDREGNVIAIKNLNAKEYYVSDTYKFGDSTQSVKLELPVNIIQEQKLLKMNDCADTTNDFDMCVRCGRNAEPNDLCRI